MYLTSEEIKKFPHIKAAPLTDFSLTAFMHGWKEVILKVQTERGDFWPVILYCNDALKVQNNTLLLRLKKLFNFVIIINNEMQEEEFKILFQAVQSSDTNDTMIIKNIGYHMEGL